MTNIEKAISFLKMAGTGDVRSAYEKYIHHDFIHHNQYFKGDRTSLMVAMEDAHRASPNKFIEIKKTYEQGDTVITHSLVAKETQDISVVHIFRFASGMVVELWDIAQTINKNSPNEHGIF